MNYEDLTERIEKAEQETKRRSYMGKDWWQGYKAALEDLRNDINTGGEQKCKKH